MQITVKTELDIAKELQEFFIGSYAEDTIQAAIDSGNAELLSLTIQNYQNERQLIEEAEELQDGCF